MIADGLTTIVSAFGPKETMDRLEAEVRSKGLTVFARVDHAAGAVAVGLPLRPTELLIFGNAKGGTRRAVPRSAAAPRNRSTLEGARVRGCSPQGVAGLRQSELDCATARARRGRQLFKPWLKRSTPLRQWQ
jgi:hypothetical protein